MTKTFRNLSILALLGAALVLVFVTISLTSQKPAPVESSTPVATAPVTSEPTVEPTTPEEPVLADSVYTEALNTLAQVADTQPHEVAKYDREAQFGRPWIDVDGNKCDTRNDILKRDMASYVLFRGDCEVQTGVLNDPYTGRTIEFTHTNAFGKNTGDSMTVQIDHMIPLAYAWYNGADAWDEDVRIIFANDPINLKAVDGKSNNQKDKNGPATWLPANTEYHCTYAVEFVQVLGKYELTVQSADRTWLVNKLTECAA